MNLGFGKCNVKRLSEKAGMGNWGATWGEEDRKAGNQSENDGNAGNQGGHAENRGGNDFSG